MIGAGIIAALIVFAGLSLGLALLEYIADKLRIAARWRLWYYKTFGGRRQSEREKNDNTVDR